MDLLDIGKLLHVAVRKLSLGERMKMELVAALLHSPKVCFLTNRLSDLICGDAKTRT